MAAYNQSDWQSGGFTWSVPEAEVDVVFVDLVLGEGLVEAGRHVHLQQKQQKS